MTIECAQCHMAIRINSDDPNQVCLDPPLPLSSPLDPFWAGCLGDRVSSAQPLVPAVVCRPIQTRILTCKAHPCHSYGSGEGGGEGGRGGETG